jgi:streptogramin lyase
MTHTSKLLALVAALTVCLPAHGADVLLNGTIISATGEKMGGVTVSAKAGTITTSVFTDETGNYYLPLPAGKYRVWAQALSFERAQNEVDLAAAGRQDFTLQPITDVERQVRQLPGDILIAALPEETADDLRMKRVVRNNCTGCHSPSYVLQYRFDEKGWHAIIELMKQINVGGVVQPPDRVNRILDVNQKELAAYLARARGPGESALRIKPRPRPSGEAARAVIREYDVPVAPELASGRPATSDGSDWSLGTPSRLGSFLHDAWADLDGNLWITCSVVNPRCTVGKIDSKTGAVKFLKVEGQHGLAAPTHGMWRDAKGALWFDVNPGRRSLGRVDPKTENIAVFQTPAHMSPVGGAVTIDIDGKGKIWASAPDGALRFDPDTLTFTEFKSVTYRTPNGPGTTYGMAADRDGNGWWAQMPLDIIGTSDVATGKSLEIKLPPVTAERERLRADELKFYEEFAGRDFNTATPWQQGPRRMGTDKNADVLWIGNSWGGSLTRIDTRTKEVSFVPLPDPVAQQPYQVAVDREHRAWTNMWTTDQVMRFDPRTSTWTAFDLPTRGSEARYISVDERDGVTQVIVPYYRTSKVAVMTVRSEADLAALKAQAGR